mgnify:CR=1 FL=1
MSGRIGSTNPMPMNDTAQAKASAHALRTCAWDRSRAQMITAIAAGIPLGAIPRPPWWFWGLIILGGAVNATFGWSAVVVYLRAVTLGLVLLASSILIIWTTPMAEVAPAIAKLMRPLRWLRLPVDEWAVAIALCLRGLPMLIDELRMLRAAHRLAKLERSRPAQATRLAAWLEAQVVAAPYDWFNFFPFWDQVPHEDGQ